MGRRGPWEERCVYSPSIDLYYLTTKTRIASYNITHSRPFYKEK